MGHEIVPYGKGKGKSVDDLLGRKIPKRTVDYGSNVVRWLEDSLVRRFAPHRLQAHYNYTRELMPSFATPQSPYDSICCRFAHSSTNKTRAPVNVVHWFPNGRRLISGSQTGEITIWNGFQFHFENIMQAHNSAVRAMQWNPEETVLVSGDQLGVVKFWDASLYNFQTFQGHKESICDLTISPTGLKFCSCADESHAKVWDIRTAEEERAFTGHGWDVKCCDWHPTKGLVATGSKDSQIKLWDPRAGEAITTIFCHKNTVTRVKWSPSGQWLASGSRDQLLMLMDIRTMSVRKVFKAHQKEVTALCWHPESDALLASGGYDSAMHFWDTHGSSAPIESVPGAHEGPIWSISWHPLGHLLASGSHDYSTRFWSRARPGDTSFVDLLPKKVAAPDRDAIALASAVQVTTSAGNTVLDAGIFAGPSPKFVPLPIIDKSAEQSTAEEAKLAVKPAPGLSMGEGASRKDVLDTSDFDAEDRGTTTTPPAAATTNGGDKPTTPAIEDAPAANIGKAPQTDKEAPPSSAVAASPLAAEAATDPSSASSEKKRPAPAATDGTGNEAKTAISGEVADGGGGEGEGAKRPRTQKAPAADEGKPSPPIMTPPPGPPPGAVADAPDANASAHVVVEGPDECGRVNKTEDATVASEVGRTTSKPPETDPGPGAYK